MILFKNVLYYLYKYMSNMFCVLFKPSAFKELFPVCLPKSSSNLKAATAFVQVNCCAFEYVFLIFHF